MKMKIMELGFILWTIAFARFGVAHDLYEITRQVVQRCQTCKAETKQGRNLKDLTADEKSVCSPCVTSCDALNEAIPSAGPSLKYAEVMRNSTEVEDFLEDLTQTCQTCLNTIKPSTKKEKDSENKRYVSA